MIDPLLKERLRSRAAGRCEYCRWSEEASSLPHVLDHIIARQHGGPTVDENLALCCGRCNRHKGPNIAGFDRVTDAVVRLFNPRTDFWPEHFHWDGAVLIGTTAIGRVTVTVLSINGGSRVAARTAIINTGLTRLVT